jgi:hypothetical protein
MIILAPWENLTGILFQTSASHKGKRRSPSAANKKIVICL